MLQHAWQVVCSRCILIRSLLINHWLCHGFRDVNCSRQIGANQCSCDKYANCHICQRGRKEI